MAWFSWFKKQGSNRKGSTHKIQIDDKKSGSFEPIATANKPKPETIAKVNKKPLVNSFCVESSFIKTLFGPANIYFSSDGATVQYVVLRRDLPEGIDLIPLVDSYSTVYSCYVVGPPKEMPNFSKKRRVYPYIKTVNMSDIDLDIYNRILEVAKIMNVDVKMPVHSSKEKLFRVALENAKMASPHNGKTLRDVIGELNEVSRYVKSSKLLMVKTNMGKYLISFEIISSIMDKEVSTLNLEINPNTQMLAKIKTKNKEREIWIYRMY